MSGGHGYAACGGDRAARRSALAGRGGRVRARPVRAALIVAAGIVLFAGAGGARAQAAWRAASESASFAGFDAVMGRVDDGFSCLPSDVPETFRDELLSVAGKRGLRCDVGREAQVRRAFERIATWLGVGLNLGEWRVPSAAISSSSAIMISGWPSCAICSAAAKLA